MGVSGIKRVCEGLKWSETEGEIVRKVYTGGSERMR